MCCLADVKMRGYEFADVENFSSISFTLTDIINMTLNSVYISICLHISTLRAEKTIQEQDKDLTMFRNY